MSGDSARPSVFISISDFTRHVVRRWYLLAMAFLADPADLYGAIAPANWPSELDVPQGISVTVALVLVVIATFMAYRDKCLELAEARDQLQSRDRVAELSFVKKALRSLSVQFNKMNDLRPRDADVAWALRTRTVAFLRAALGPSFADEFTTHSGANAKSDVEQNYAMSYSRFCLRSKDVLSRIAEQVTEADIPDPIDPNEWADLLADHK